MCLSSYIQGIVDLYAVDLMYFQTLTSKQSRKINQYLLQLPQTKMPYFTFKSRQKTSILEALLRQKQPGKIGQKYKIF
jgi:hypothetical protein